MEPTPDLQQLLHRIEKLEARHAIAELASAYAIACDEHDMERLIGLFTADAVFDSPNKAMVANGREDIRAMFIRMFKVRGPGYHWTHDHFVEFDAADPTRATGLVLSHAETCPDGVASLAAMRYRDAYRREGGRWLFERRAIEFLYYVPFAEYGQALVGKQRVKMGERRLAADYPESLAVWQAFDREHKRSV